MIGACACMTYERPSLVALHLNVDSESSARERREEHTSLSLQKCYHTSESQILANLQLANNRLK